MVPFGVEDLAALWANNALQDLICRSIVPSKVRPVHVITSVSVTGPLHKAAYFNLSCFRVS